MKRGNKRRGEEAWSRLLDEYLYEARATIVATNRIQSKQIAKGMNRVELEL